MKQVSEITGMTAENGVLFVKFADGRESKTGLITCNMLTSQQDNELAEIIAERFTAVADIKREDLPTLRKMLGCQASDLLLLIKTGAVLLKLTDAVKAVTPEGEALPEALAATMAEAEGMIAELNQAAEERQQVEKHDSDETPAES